MSAQPHPCSTGAGTRQLQKRMSSIRLLWQQSISWYLQSPHSASGHDSFYGSRIPLQGHRTKENDRKSRTVIYYPEVQKKLYINRVQVKTVHKTVQTVTALMQQEDANFGYGWQLKCNRTSVRDQLETRLYINSVTALPTPTGLADMSREESNKLHK